MALFDSEKVKLGISPIGWCNDDIPELGAENTFRQTVSEMALAGFEGCEIGNKFPVDPQILRWEMELRGMRVASCWFSSFLLTRSLEENITCFENRLDFLASLGANRINVSEQSYSIQGQIGTPIMNDKHRHFMNNSEWETLCKGLDCLGKTASLRGFKLCFHHHMGTVVQSAAETDRLMQSTDPRYVFLCFDTGHFGLAGEDVSLMLQKYADRVGHVHLKDIRALTSENARRYNWSFLTAVRNGIFTVPGDGDIDFDPIFTVLSDTGYEGWLLIEAEQDPVKANPLEYAIRGRRYIAEHTGL